ncbi:MAG TPA: hypothetical protein VGR35_00290 [Tepidisphaeraceae bacterium]|nr:hypothetical protein [Tepidisphaeraceae bacterium]
MTQAGLREHPFLLKWYEKHGFAIEEPDEECIEGVVRKIVRRR